MTRTVVGIVVAALFATATPVIRAAPAAACDWPVTLGYEGLNLLAPDTAANYWILSYASVPGGRLRIRGHYPHARYFSLTAQDAGQITLGSLRDDGLDPDRGSSNPYRPGGMRHAVDRYTAYISFDPLPDDPRLRARNTFYVGRNLDGLPNPGGTLVYRVYVPQRSATGGVPLPEVTLEAPSGTETLTFSRCQSVPPPVQGPANRETNAMSRPDGFAGPAPLSADYRRPPDFVRIHEGDFTDPAVTSLPDPPRSALPHRKGVPLANADFPYLRSQLHRAYGQVAVVRFLAPTFPDTTGGERVTARRQVRYWSMCNNSATEDSLLRTTGCLTDYLTKTDRRGRVTVVIADPDHRPNGVINPSRGVHWLPWGPYAADMLLYRVGIPASGWAGSPRRVAKDAPDQVAAAKAAMGAWYPAARYCARGTIERRGLDVCFR